VCCIAVMLLLQFYLSKLDLSRFEREMSQTNRREILMQAARSLPMQCRTISGGKLLDLVCSIECFMCRTIIVGELHDIVDLVEYVIC